MDINKILKADFLDILFEGRNKDYGAYLLRKTYSSRMRNAFLAVLAGTALAFGAAKLQDSMKSEEPEKIVAEDVVLEDVAKKKDEPPPPPPPPPPPEKQVAEPPKLEIAKFTTPKVVKDNEVKEDEKPPTVDKIEESKIGFVNQEGMKNVDVVAPPVEKGTGSVVAPVAVEEDYDKVFTKVEIKAEFPGGAAAWKRYLERNLNYPDEAQEAGVSAVVRVQFIVDKQGKISEVVALDKPGHGLEEEAVRIIKKGPDWKPAEQNGRKVIYKHIQSITFRMN